MSIFGALNTGISGMNGQSTTIATISNNIANVDTIGYKGAHNAFSTFVTNTGTSTSYSSGGIISNIQNFIDKQGLIQGTDVSTDIAISGNGFFVVTDDPTAPFESRNIFYTRAGSFQEDHRGYLKNTSGYYLLSWPLDSGLLPGEQGNLNTISNATLESLEPVNTRIFAGVASSTSNVSVGMNLNASQNQFAGAEVTIDILSGNNMNNLGEEILVPNANMVVNDTFEITSGSSDISKTFVYGGFEEGNSITAGILGATNTSASFTAATAGDGLTIQIGVSPPETFTYVNNSPNVANNEFNNLQSLVDSINSKRNMTARIVNNQIYISPKDAQINMTIADNNTSGTSNFATALGIINAGTGNVGNRFSTLGALRALLNVTEGISSSMTSDKLKILLDKSIDTITYGSTGAGDMLAEFGIANSTYATTYDFTDSTKNMASGNVKPFFSRPVRFFDSLGTGHDFRVDFIKVDQNQWAVEVYASDTTEINVLGRTDGQIASGYLSFNGDGTLSSVGTTLQNSIPVNWTNGATPDQINFDFGTAGDINGTIGSLQYGKADGVRQFDADYTVEFVNQDGISSGLLTSVNIDAEGFIAAQFSNGQSSNVYKVPLADFANPNGLSSKTGNIFVETQNSGRFNLREVNKGGVGGISPASLESSNVELVEELTNMIPTQSNYQSCAKVIQTLKEMIDENNKL